MTLVEDGASFILANGFVTARVYKQAGTFTLKYKDLDVIGRGYWSEVGRSSAGGTGPLPDTGVMHRDGIRGYWCERAVAFDAALMKRGTNVLKLKVPATSWVNGVLYDYLRLELDESAPPPKTN